MTKVRNMKMKKITLNKKGRVEAPVEFKAKGIVAFQVVEFVIDYFGSLVVTHHDTEIRENGKQLVIGGCGFIPHGYEVSQ